MVQYLGLITGVYIATGNFTPNKDVYDFDDNASRGFIANAATGVGRISGAFFAVYSAGILKPVDYDIYFEVSVDVAQGWR